MINIIDQRIKRHLQGIRMAFRGVITLVKAASQVQLVQLDGVAGEQLQSAELFQQYGFTSNPLPGSMGIVLPIGGKTAHGIVIATEHGTYRLKNLAPGEVALYSDEGDHVILKRGRVVEVVTQTFNLNASTAVNITTPTVNISHDLHVGNDIVAAGDIYDHIIKSMAVMRDAHNLHHHVETGGTTNVPDRLM